MATEKDPGLELQLKNRVCPLLILLSPNFDSFLSGFGQARITVLVTNSVTNSPNHTYGTYVYYRGILLGGLRRLQDSDSNFT